MKKYKVTIEIREKENPDSNNIESVIVEVEAEKNEDVPKLALEKINLPSTKIWWNMCWS